jgi:hypothetical protein
MERSVGSTSALPDLLRRTIAATFGGLVTIDALEKVAEHVDGEHAKVVHRLELAGPGGLPINLYAKTGNSAGLRAELTLYEQVFAGGTSLAPRLLGSGVEQDTVCFLLEAIGGQQFDPTDREHLALVFHHLAIFHQHNQPLVDALVTVRPGLRDPAPPWTMFDRLGAMAKHWEYVGLQHADLTIFSHPGVTALVASEPATLVHGDLQPRNVLVDLPAETVHLLDYDCAAIRPGTSEFMYFSYLASPNLLDGDPDLTGDRLHYGLRCYYEAVRQAATFAELQMRQFYWHASYFADCLSWMLGWRPRDTDRKGHPPEVTDVHRAYAATIRDAGSRLAELMSD